MPDEPKRAAALRYSGTGAPSVTAAGRGLIAEKILAGEESEDEDAAE